MACTLRARPGAALSGLGRARLFGGQGGDPGASSALRALRRRRPAGSARRVRLRAPGRHGNAPRPRACRSAAELRPRGHLGRNWGPGPRKRCSLWQALGSLRTLGDFRAVRGGEGAARALLASAATWAHGAEGRGPR